MKPPMLTMPDAVPSVARGLKVRAKSNPTIDPGPPTEMTTTRTTSSQSGARPGRASTTDQMTALLAMMQSTSRDLRCGWRPVKMPIRMPAEMAATTEMVSRVPATGCRKTLGHRQIRDTPHQREHRHRELGAHVCEEAQTCPGPQPHRLDAGQ